MSDQALRDLVLARPFLRRITAQGFRGIGGPLEPLQLLPGTGDRGRLWQRREKRARGAVAAPAG